MASSDNEKTKLIVVIALAVVVVGVGAFQFIRLGQPDPAATKTTAGKPSGSDAIKTGELAKGSTPQGNLPQNPTGNPQDPAAVDPQRVELAKMIAGSLPQRDPFQPILLPGAKIDPNASKPVEPAPSQPTEPKVAPRPKPKTLKGSPNMSIPPMDPLPGAFPGGSAVAGNFPGRSLEPAPPLRMKDELAYKLSGVMLGEKPVAVLTDDQGNQRLVPLGGKIDAESKVVSIDRGKVVVKHKGKAKTLTIGGNSNAK